MLNKTILKEDIERVRKEIGEIPTKEKYRIYGKYAVNSIIRYFNSWSKAMSEIFTDYYPRQSSVHKQCAFCNKDIIVGYSNLKEKNYCSTSCSNKGKPRRQAEGKCKLCDARISKSRIYCKNCLEKRNYNLQTLGAIREKRQDAGCYSCIRGNARKKILGSKIQKSCYNCGYDKHLEVCHKKPISKFSNNTTVEEINDISNLIYLCPNCHWEFDNGLLKF